MMDSRNRERLGGGGPGAEGAGQLAERLIVGVHKLLALKGIRGACLNAKILTSYRICMCMRT